MAPTDKSHNPLCTCPTVWWLKYYDITIGIMILLWVYSALYLCNEASSLKFNSIFYTIIILTIF